MRGPHGAGVPGANWGEEEQINAAIMASMSGAQGNPGATGYEPLGVEQRRREESVPVGLKNIGNTCYFNSIL